MWNTLNGELINTLEGQAARISQLKFSEDDKMLASASYDGSVVLWRTDQFNASPLVLSDHETRVHSIIFSQNGNELLTGSKEGLIKSWYTSPEFMAEEICNDLKRNLTPKEWVKYVAEDISYEKTCEQLP